MNEICFRTNISIQYLQSIIHEWITKSILKHQITQRKYNHKLLWHNKQNSKSYTVLNLIKSFGFIPIQYLSFRAPKRTPSFVSVSAATTKNCSANAERPSRARTKCEGATKPSKSAQNWLTNNSERNVFTALSEERRGCESVIERTFMVL